MNNDKKSDKDQKAQVANLAEKSHALADGIEIGSNLGASILTVSNTLNSYVNLNRTIPNDSDEDESDSE